uniref:N-acetylglucosaminylphosphatidylinositol deacetylase n=1 Tax=Oryzias latipes TaxID=8090 RepID=A0A3P9L3P0_ORYLA
MYVYLVVFVILSYLVCIRYIYLQHRRTLVKSLKYVMKISADRELNNANVTALIVTAHPDDECMFFAPTIIRLRELNVSVHLLCLSEGNYYNQGPERHRELVSSCAVLGIPNSRITIIDDEKLPDDPKAEWSTALISSVVAKHLRAHTFNLVLTFDGSGVSGHANHVAIYKAIRLWRVCSEEVRSPGFKWGLSCSLPGRHAVSWLSALVVSPPLHRLLTLHVCKHIPGDSTGTKDHQNLLKAHLCVTLKLKSTAWLL